VARQVVNSMAETKYIGQWLTTTAIQNGVSPFNPYAWENVVQQLGALPGGTAAWRIALPAMIQGDETYTRQGNRIEPTGHHVKMTLRFAPEWVDGVAQAQDNPLDVTAYIFYGYIKSLKTYQGSAAATYNGSSMCVTGQNEATRAYQRLLDVGDGTQTSFSGDIGVAQYPLSDYVNMRVKKVHLRRGLGYVNTNAGNGGAVGSVSPQNTLSRTFSLKFKPPAKLAYREETDIYPENYAPVFAVGYVFNDATASGNNAAPAYPSGQLEYIAQAQIWYKDHQ